jgi:glyoxylase-like metal-dependent hydrolase (beta-lactamase superfamily II)
MAAALLVVASQASAQNPDLSQVPVKVVPVTAGVYMLTGAGGNIGLSVGSDDAFVVDDQYAPMTAKIRAAIATVTQKPVRFVLNTHWHGDHTGGNEAMSGAGAMIVAHDNVRRRMGTQQFIAALNDTVPPSPAKALPVVTFSETITFYVNGDSVRAVHLRDGHTDGDAIIVFQKANVIHMGDLFFNGMYPFIDASTGGSAAGTVAAVDSVLLISNAQTQFIPGHGPLGTRADLVSYRDMLKAMTDRVSKLIAQGMTVQQVVAARPSADYDAKWGGGFLKPDQFVGTLYASIKPAGSR